MTGFGREQIRFKFEFLVGIFNKVLSGLVGKQTKGLWKVM